MTAPLPRRRALAAAGLVAMLSAALAGCVVAPVGAYRQPYYGEADAAMEPPPPRGEVIGVAPVPGWFWIGGYWGWRGGAHYWNPGRWEAPRPGYRWAPHQWQQRGRGWYESPGYWQRR